MNKTASQSGSGQEQPKTKTQQSQSMLLSPGAGTATTSTTMFETNSTVKSSPSTSIDSVSTTSYASAKTRSSNSNIRRGESWDQTFKRCPANPPSEILPGLYLGNIKTAAAYLTGRAESQGLPPVSYMLTVLTDDGARFGYADLPEPTGEGRRVQRMVIKKADATWINLLEDFDDAAEFIHRGLRGFFAGRQSQTELSDPVEDIMDRLTAIRREDEVRRESPTKMRSGVANNSQPDLDVGFSGKTNQSIRSNATSTTSKLTATGQTSRSTHSIIAAKTPFDRDMIRPRLRISTSQDSTTTSNLEIQTSRSIMTRSTRKPGGVLVHCHAGVSRSTTILIAYLLKHHLGLLNKDRTTYESLLPSLLLSNPAPPPTRHITNPSILALEQKHPHRSSEVLAIRMFEFVKDRRPFINPNAGFRNQLCLYVELGCALRDGDGDGEEANGVLKERYVNWMEENRGRAPC